MPEGDSVFRAAAQLHAALAGQQLISSDFRVPRFATLKLDGWTVEEVVPRGKHLLMRPCSRRGSARCRPAEPEPERNRTALTIHSHLKMEGAWQIYRSGRALAKARLHRPVRAAHRHGRRRRIFPGHPGGHPHLRGGLRCGPPRPGPPRPGLGPGRGRAPDPRRPEVPIGVALLDQRNLAGIGNIYRCEACFLSGVHPAAPVSSVPDLAAMITHAKVLLEANLGPGRRSTVLSPGGRSVGRTPGLPGYWVYRREHQPCVRCRTPVRRGVLARDTGTEERDIYYCPNCQPAPGPNNARPA